MRYRLIISDFLDFLSRERDTRQSVITAQLLVKNKRSRQRGFYATPNLKFSVASMSTLNNRSDKSFHNVTPAEVSSATCISIAERCIIKYETIYRYSRSKCIVRRSWQGVDLGKEPFDFTLDSTGSKSISSLFSWQRKVNSFERNKIFLFSPKWKKKENTLTYFIVILLRCQFASRFASFTFAPIHSLNRLTSLRKTLCSTREESYRKLKVSTVEVVMPTYRL